MDLAAIRTGIGDLLETIAGVRAYETIPGDVFTSSDATAVVVQPGDPYVSYAEGAGLVQRHDLRYLLRIVPPPASLRSAQVEIDSLLSCGTGQTRSIRAALLGDLSLGGSACAVSVLSASGLREVRVASVAYVVCDVEIRVLARCD